MGILRWLIILVLAYLAYRAIRSILAKKEIPRGEPKGSIDEMVQDPHCRTYVPMRQAEKRIIKGRQYYFCSAKCADDFEKQHK
ncbi:MAG: YHS domain-containing protein [Desulfobacteraceae bacterium]|jgi:YHS domain-containing protein|nr:MAG: YHS domain-containing protein [Desulfobacteraceae bacterium]